MPFKKKTTWLLIGDGVGAQLYTVHALPFRITKVAGGLIKATPKNSRWPEHRPDTRHTATSTRGSAVAQRHENVFVEHVAAKVEAAAASKRFDDIIVVLPPKALAHFRKAVGPLTQKKIKQQIRSEWTQLAKPDIEKHLAKRLP